MSHSRIQRSPNQAMSHGSYESTCVTGSSPKSPVRVSRQREIKDEPTTKTVAVLVQSTTNLAIAKMQKISNYLTSTEDNARLKAITIAKDLVISIWLQNDSHLVHSSCTVLLAAIEPMVKQNPLR